MVYVNYKHKQMFQHIAIFSAHITTNIHPDYQLEIFSWIEFASREYNS